MVFLLLEKLSDDLAKYAVPGELIALLNKLSDKEPDYDISDNDIIEADY